VHILLAERGKRKEDANDERKNPYIKEKGRKR